MTGVEIDEESGRARVLAGTLSRDVLNAAAGCGKAALCGSSPDVGMVGYSLGGGIGWLGRKHGIQANAVTAVELVTADGELVRADGENEADLFWALRGGGGNFGVITAIEFDLMPVADPYAGMLAWPWERSEEVLKAWAEWAPGAPEEITTSARILQFPPIPEHPRLPPRPQPGDDRRRSLRQRRGGRGGAAALPRARARARHVGDDADARRWSRSTATPSSRPPRSPTTAWCGSCPRRRSRHSSASPAPGSGSPLLFAELRQFGGAIARPPETPSAIGALSDPFCMFALGLAMDPDSARAMAEHGEKVRETMAPWAGRRQYYNFAERPGERRLTTTRRTPTRGFSRCGPRSIPTGCSKQTTDCD